MARSNRWLNVPEVAAGKPVNGSATIAAVPGGAQQWIWAAAAGPPVSPENTSLTFSVFRAWSRVTVMKPVAGDGVGGTASDPVRAALNTVIWAPAGAPRSAIAATAAVVTSFLCEVGETRVTRCMSVPSQPEVVFRAP